MLNEHMLTIHAVVAQPVLGEVTAQNLENRA